MLQVRIKGLRNGEIAVKYGVFKGEKYKVMSHAQSEGKKETVYIIQGDNLKIPIAVYSDEIDLIENPMSVILK